MTNSPINDRGLYSLFAGCHHLEILSLSSCHILASEDLDLIATSPSAKRLKYLCLAQFQNATDAGLAEIARGCPNLEVFLIHYAPGITNHGVQYLASGCEKLEWIKVVGCRNVTLGVLD